MKTASGLPLLMLVMFFCAACSMVSEAPARAPASMRGMLEAHNRVRAGLGLLPLSWSPQLAAYSQDWSGYLASARGCRMIHRQEAGKDYRQYGENLFWGSPEYWSDGRRGLQQVTAAQVADDWAGERQHYHYGSNSCRPGEQCGHYTQMVWRSTTQVGCGTSFCPNYGQVWVCSYNPPGNWIGVRPY